ncbi:hypothetical protein NLJ89_g6339 [Agrocybe chaxingu]|uniref:Uncharacterized protein n=1 Tax=Agrocybe chaxingu TaxID=84603 RepID=A0A9W8JYG8_9AGAR|nr:hypothetical protein NLJ89_g6339 [Agrocybe chaxingu]
MANIEASSSAGDKDGLQAPPPVQPSAPLVQPIMDGITFIKERILRAIDDVLKPAIASSFRYFDADPRFEAILSTPLLIGLSLAGAIFSLSAAILVLWSAVSIVSGAFFLILVQLISLAFSLFIAALVTVLIAGVSIARNQTDPAQQPLWDQIVLYSAMTFKAARATAPLVRSAWTGIIPLGRHLFSWLVQFMTAMSADVNHQLAASQAAEQHVVPEITTPAPAPAPVAAIPEAPSQVEVLSAASSEGLKRREPFADAGDQGKE